jgi:Ala-tRNA(Pro) deacylase
MNGDPNLYNILKELNIEFEYHEHPAIPTIEAAKKYWKDLIAGHCKNLFFRNHKGKKHYLVIFDYAQNLAIRDLEQRLKQGKLTFASERRMDKYLGVKAGSVSPFNLINDIENHVHVFIDKNLLKSEFLSFHPNDNTATLIIEKNDLVKFLEFSKNTYEFIDLY